MKFKELVDHLDSKPKQPEKMTIDRFMDLLSPGEKAELKKAEKESREKGESKKRKQKD